MKLFYILILFVFTLCNTNAQTINNQPLFDLKCSIFENAESIEIPINTDIIPILHPVSIKSNKTDNEQILENLDTLSDYFNRASGFIIYSYQYQTFYLPVVGYNTFYHFIGTKYETQNNVNILGILVAYGAKALVNNYDSLYILICRGDAGSGLPIEVLNANSFTLERIDTSIAAPLFSAIMFENPQVVNSRWVILLQTRRGNANEDDFNAIFSNMQGDGRNENSACFGVVQNQQLMSNNLSSLPLNINQAPLDFDVMILPIIDYDITDVKDDINIDGIWISDVYPNPASNNINITIKTEQPCIITFNLIGLDGKVIKTVTANSAIKGQRTVSFDVSDISSGNYYVGIFSNKTKFAFKVKIVK